jgi:hypothetical protein
MKYYPLIDYETEFNHAPTNDPDPIRHYSGLKEGWFFWNETWTDLHGPFETFLECKEALKVYYEEL